MNRPARTPRLASWIAAVCAAIGLLATPAPAVAQSAKDLAAARKAFKEGEDAETAGDLATAVSKFQQALAIKETPQLHLRIGAVMEKMGNLAGALAEYQTGLDKAASQAEVAKVAREQIAALKPRVPMIEVKLPTSSPAELVVTLDGTTLPASAYTSPLPVNPGMHQLEAKAKGFAPRRQEVFAKERSMVTADLALEPLTIPNAPPPATPSKVPGAAITGAGAAALVAGVVMIGVSYAKDSTINGQCGGSERLHCPTSMKDQILGEVSTVNALRFSGLGVGVLGAGGAAVGAVLLVRGRF